MDKEEYLNGIINAEIKKSNKMDTDIIGECVDLLLELKNIKIELSEEEIKHRANSIISKNYKVERKVFKPGKTMAAAAAVVLIFALINIQTVIAFIGGLFFVPGAGVTRGTDISYYGIDGPVDIMTDYGVITLKFANKITRNGETMLSLYFHSYDITALKWQEGDYPLIISISADGKNIVSDEVLLDGGNWGIDEVNPASYVYTLEEFPDVNEFYLTLQGVDTRISLMHQPGNFALSRENNGITLAAYKFNGVNDMLAFDVFDGSESADDFHVFCMSPKGKYYDKNGEEIRISGGRGGFQPNDLLHYQIVEFYKNEKEIKSLKADYLHIVYRRNEWLPVEIPVPENGETMRVNIEIPVGSHTYRLTKLYRENNKIYYEGSEQPITVWDEGGPEYRQKITDRETHIIDMLFAREDWETNPMRMRDGEIWGFDDNADTLTFYFYWAEVIQFGEFDIEFD